MILVKVVFWSFCFYFRTAASLRRKIISVNPRSRGWRGSRFTSSGLRPPSPHPMRRRNYFVERFPGVVRLHRPTPG
jgi:hypothetical protein